MNVFVILYLSFVSFDLWLSIICIGNLSGFFIILGGGLGWWGCCGNGGCRGFSCILGVNSLFTDMYCALSVRACGCLLHGFVQCWLQLWWQKSFSAICSAFFSSFVGVL